MNDRRAKQLTALGLFLLALLPRVVDLGRFLSPDEFLWAERSKQFSIALVSGDLAGTLRTGHPGVTTMWTGLLGLLYRYLVRGPEAPADLLSFLQAVPTDPLNIANQVAMRVPTVIISALLVVALYFLVAALFDETSGLVAATILALDPFHIAYSRILHHDALETTFMTLALLGMLIYLRGGARRWLLGASFASALAMLSKSSALFLFPFVALLLGLEAMACWLRRSPPGETLRRALLTYLAWALGTAAAFVLCWPAMWVNPLKPVATVLDLGLHYAGGPHAKGVFLLGQSTLDPGPLFYPLNWAFSITPLVVLGLLALAVSALRRPTGHGWIGQQGLRLPATGYLLLYAVIFVVFMNFGGKKQARYILPVFPIVDILAAVGLVWAGRWLAAWGEGKLPKSDRLRKSWRWLGLLAVALPQLAVTLPTYPYYITYYNPLLGGLPAAARTITVGWGEGLDEAARYMSSKPDAAQLKVAAWYASTFAPFFPGQTLSYAKEKERTLAGDYVIFYINQMQRRYPDEEMFRFFEERYQVDKVIQLQGVDYAWIYPAPGMQHRVEDSALTTYRGIAALLGWDWLGADGPARPTIPAGGELHYKLYWEYLGKAENEPIFFHLLDEAGQVWGEGSSTPLPITGPYATWRKGQIIEEEGKLVVRPDTPPGEYRLQIGFYTAAVAEGVLFFSLPPEEEVITVVSSGVLW
jgi:4-amino-4-deoxy-L-arabinose transferase-like glycosyltransferase